MAGALTVVSEPVSPIEPCNIALSERWINVWPEPWHDGIEDSFATPVDADELPLTPSTRARLQAWCDWSDDAEDYLPINSRKRVYFSHDDFWKEGLAITRLIRAELPEWTVTGCDMTGLEVAASMQPLPKYPNRRRRFDC